MPAEPARGRTTRSLHSWLAFLFGDDSNKMCGTTGTL